MEFGERLKIPFCRNTYSPSLFTEGPDALLKIIIRDAAKMRKAAAGVSYPAVGIKDIEVNGFGPPEGVPVNPYATGIPKTAAHPNAAKLYLNWCLSKEGQTFMIKEQGNLTSLKEAPVYPEGFDPKIEKAWYPKFDEYVKLHADWVAQWDKTFGYRQ